MAEDVELKRRCKQAARAAKALATDSTSPVFDVSAFATGGYVITALATAATITFYVAAATGTADANGNNTVGTLKALKDRNNTAVTQSISADSAYPLPDECFPFAFVQLRIDAGTCTIDFQPKS